MTKQEEISEGMRSHLKRFYTRCFGKEPEGMAINYLEHCLENQMLCLATQGVVLKVERELPICFGGFRSPANQRENDYLLGWNDNKDVMLKAGYVVVEPLVKESKCK